jgi:signal transduction histidine kinase
MEGPLRTDGKRFLQLRRLTEVSRALTYAVSLEEVLRLTVERAAELLEADKAVIMLTNPDGLLSVRAAHGLGPEVTARFREPLNETLIHRLQGLLGVQPSAFLGVPLVVGGEVTGLLAVARMPHEESVEEHEWLLSALADQAAVALEKTRLDETVEFRERLMGIVGHDLRSPLQAIKMGAEALLRREKLEAPETKVVRRIADSALRMERMIEQLLDFTRSRLGGGIPLKRERTALSALCREVLEELELAHPEATLQFEPQGEPEGAWDRERLTQVLSNLIGNAIQHGARGTPITVRTLDADGSAQVDVHNEGPPIPPELLPYLFDPFRQGTSAATSSGTSLGLGLYIAEQIVRGHEGHLAVTSSEAEGTTFTVRLPKQPPGGAATTS